MSDSEVSPDASEQGPDKPAAGDGEGATGTAPEASSDGNESGDEGAKAASGPELRGDTVAPGLVLGVVHRKDYDLQRERSQRVPLDSVDLELNRFQKALEESKRQLLDLKSRLVGKVDADDARILDTHLTYLKDSVFIADIENLILNEQMRLEAGITKVINDFDRIFRLVQNETLRQSAVDLRDVGIRVLRNLESEKDRNRGEVSPQEYILVARELSIVDMFNLSNERVMGIATEGGGLTSHAAIFARSMRIPTITNVAGLLDAANEGDFVILDASEGVLRIRPDEVVRQQYLQSDCGEEQDTERIQLPDWAQAVPKTSDGQRVILRSSCGNLPEVEQGSELGLPGVGLYRTELLFLVDREPPSREKLVNHYAGVIEKAGAEPVTFRLLNVDSSLTVPYLHPEAESNPHLGRVGIRILLAKEAILRRQLRAILLAGARAKGPVRIAVPFATDVSELRRVKEILFEERLELRKGGESFREKIELGTVVETAAACMGVADLARESDFMTVNLDSLVQYLLAADRENGSLSFYFEQGLHPFVLRALQQICDACTEQERPLSVFGVLAADPLNTAMLLGIGLREFCLPPASLQEFMAKLTKINLATVSRAARSAARCSSYSETQSVVQSFRHGYAP